MKNTEGSIFYSLFIRNSLFLPKLMIQFGLFLLIALNAPPLIAKRKAAWKDADAAFWQDEEILELNEIGDWQGILKRTSELLEEQLNKTFHLCVVYRTYYQSQL